MQTGIQLPAKDLPLVDDDANLLQKVEGTVLRLFGKFMAAKEELHTFCVEKLQELRDPGHHESDGIQQRFEELIGKAGLSDKQASDDVAGIYWGCV